MLKGGSKERKNERTNGRTNGGKPGRRRWSEGKPRSRSIDRCDANRESRFVHIEKSSIIIRFPLPTSRSFQHPISFRRVLFHSFRRFPRSMIIDPSLRASCILVIAHRRPRRRASSSSSSVPRSSHRTHLSESVHRVGSFASRCPARTQGRAEEIPSEVGGSRVGVGAGVCSVFLGHHPSILTTKEKKRRTPPIDRSRVVCVLVGKGKKDTKISGEDFHFGGEISLLGGSCVIFHMNSVFYGYSTVHVNIL
jgi:hypothetical protein